MHVKVVATASTSVEKKAFQNLIFPLPYTKKPDGSFEFCFEYKTKREASQFLRKQAHMLAFNSIEQREFMDEIKKYDRLTVDAVTARIERNK